VLSVCAVIAEGRHGGLPLQRIFLADGFEKD
jgi:hypothetical protein